MTHFLINAGITCDFCLALGPARILVRMKQTENYIKYYQDQGVPKGCDKLVEVIY